jgi:hypothetical protein
VYFPTADKGTLVGWGPWGEENASTPVGPRQVSGLSGEVYSSISIL